MKLFVSTAATKKQLSNAELVFGKTGEKVVTGLEALNKVFKHPQISNFLDLLRGSEEVVEKWAASKSGVKAIENLKIAGTSKSVEKVLGAVTSIKAIPSQDKTPVGRPQRPKDDKPTYFGSYRPSVPVPSSEKDTKVGKYELTDERIKVNGKTLYRIKALKSFGKVRAGDLGGYIQSEKNLSHDGNAWVYDNAQVAGNAKVYGNAQVYGSAQVYGNAQVYDNSAVGSKAQVYGSAQVRNSAEVGGYARVSDKAEIYGEADVSGKAQVFDKAKVFGKAHVTGDAEVYGNAQVSDGAMVYGKAEVYGKARVVSYAVVYGDAMVYGNAEVSDSARVFGKAQVYGKAHVLGKAQVSGTTQVTGNQEVSK